MVVPAVGTDAKAGLLLVDHVQFREHVQALGHRTARREVAVAVIVVPAVGQLAVGTFHALAVVELEGVVETHRQVFVARIDFQGLRGRDAHPGQDCCSQKPSTQVCMADLIVVVHLTGSPSLWFMKTH
ncbi:hypothetical protein D3C87_1564870 [compost metagenome]